MLDSGASKKISSGGWVGYDGSGTFSGSVSDTLSGSNSRIYYRKAGSESWLYSSFMPGKGSTNYEVSCEDRVGNRSDIINFEINRDVVNPSATASFTSTGFQVHYEDDASGLAADEKSVTITYHGGSASPYGQSCICYYVPNANSGTLSYTASFSLLTPSVARNRLNVRI